MALQEQLHSAQTVDQLVSQSPLDNSNKESTKSFSAVIPAPLWRNFSLTLSGFNGTHPEVWEVTDNNDRNESVNEFSEIIRSYSPISQ
jgi:hypothetical protein